MLRIPHCLDNWLIDGGKVVSRIITILGISHRPVFYLKGLFVHHRNHIRSPLRAVSRFVTSYKGSKSYPRKRPWRPIGLLDVKDPALLSP
jgi:hypothetical protein